MELHNFINTNTCRAVQFLCRLNFLITYSVILIHSTPLSSVAIRPVCIFQYLATNYYVRFAVIWYHTALPLHTFVATSSQPIIVVSVHTYGRPCA